MAPFAAFTAPFPRFPYGGCPPVEANVTDLMASDPGRRVGTVHVLF